mmetsp:Transcript_23721/g.56149  ORF Transcript_23721/g.56149 Transcript_23721/m.56149 type:complete len:202 (-) Transcript_23721:324-929(-)
MSADGAASMRGRKGSIAPKPRAPSPLRAPPESSASTPRPRSTKSTSKQSAVACSRSGMVSSSSACQKTGASVSERDGARMATSARSSRACARARSRPPRKVWTKRLSDGTSKMARSSAQVSRACAKSQTHTSIARVDGGCASSPSASSNGFSRQSKALARSARARAYSEECQTAAVTKLGVAQHSALAGGGGREASRSRTA